MNIPRETTSEILRDACRAPSGDNAQPWRFAVKKNVIRVMNVPEKDDSLFNYRQMTNYVALGACVENIRISAEGRVFRTKVQLFPEPTNPLVVAEVELMLDVSVKNELARYITKRVTNRKPYHSKAIEPEKLNTLAALAKDIGGRIVFITDKEKIKEIACSVSAGEKLAIENRSIHDFLFKHVTWTKKEDDKEHGFYIDTFEFNPVQRIAFRIFSNWNILNFFLPLGVSNLVANDAEKLHATAAAFGAIVFPKGVTEDYLKVGVLLERVWLAATSLDLSLQPTTTVHFIGARVLSGDPGDLSAPHQELLKSRLSQLLNQFNVLENERITFIFRLGYGDPPSGITSRFAPEVVFED